MKIGSVTRATKLPNPGAARGQYSEIWEAVQKLRPGQALPVEMKGAHEARSLQGAVSGQRLTKKIPGVRTHREGSTLWFIYDKEEA